MADDDITRLVALADEMVRAMPVNRMALELRDIAARMARNRAPKPASKPAKPRPKRTEYMRAYMRKHRARKSFG